MNNMDNIRIILILYTDENKIYAYVYICMYIYSLSSISYKY